MHISPAESVAAVVAAIKANSMGTSTPAFCCKLYPIACTFGSPCDDDVYLEYKRGMLKNLSSTRKT
jgi:hypothetical protein